MRRLARHIAIGLLGLATAGRAASQVEVRAELTPDPVGLDETARLTLVVESAGFGLPRVDPGFLLDNLEGAGGPSRSQSTSWINGESRSRLDLTWRLRPAALGKARVHQLRIEVGGEIRTLPDLEIAVVEQAPPGRAQPPSGRTADPLARLFEEDPFGLFPRRRQGEPAVQPKLAVRSLVEPTSAWVGEQVLWTLALDTQTDISAFRPREMPDLAGFWARELELPERPRPVWVDVEGERFGRVPMVARALFPLRAGELAIGAVTVDVLARMADADWIGRIRRDEPLVLATRPTTLAVRPLPQSPPGFSELVGELSLAATVDPATIDAGQATTVVVRAATTGNGQGLTPPRLDLPAGLRSFDPSTATSESSVDGRLTTEIEWRYVVLADTVGEHLLPPLRMVRFDPQAERYETVSTPPLRLEVRPGATPNPSVSEPPPSTESTTPSPLPPATAGLTPGVLAALGALAVLAATLAGMARRRRRVGDPVRRLRADLAAARAVESPREAAKAIDEAWRRALAERFQISRGTPMAQWPDALERAGWRLDRTRELMQLFEEVHLLEFAPELADAEALRLEVERRARELARRLR